jgi:hypothetical protein
MLCVLLMSGDKARMGINVLTRPEGLLYLALRETAVYPTAAEAAGSARSQADCCIFL